MKQNNKYIINEEEKDLFVGLLKEILNRDQRVRMNIVDSRYDIDTYCLPQKAIDKINKIIQRLENEKPEKMKPIKNRYELIDI